MHSGKTARPDIKYTAEISKKKFKKLPVLEQILKLFYRYQPSQYFFTYSGIKLKNIFLPEDDGRVLYSCCRLFTNDQ